MKTLLAIESSCDETSVAVLREGRSVALTISSQVEFHKPYGGVVPELASRHHMEAIHPLVDKTLEQAGLTLDELDGIAVTVGPGLSGSLLVGVAVAKMLGALLDIPVVGVNHMEGHLYSVRLEHEVECPFLCLVCSGGHTQLVRVETEGRHEILGETRDDAAGEAFDKVAKLLGLGYPGGPVIDQLCRDNGDPKAYDFPRPMQKSPFEFSFSGLKTAVRRVWAECGEDPERLPDIAASFQEAVVDTLVGKLMGAAKRLELKRLAVVGGVACNSRLRAKLTERAAKKSLQVFFPKPLYCTDNAAMIGKAAWELRDYLLKIPPHTLDVKVNMEMLGTS